MRKTAKTWLATIAKLVFAYRMGFGMVKRAKRAQPGDVVKPTKFRHQHGTVERLPNQITDDDGKISRPFRAFDTLERMERNGTITREQRAVGAAFHADFVAAGWVGVRAADLNRLSVGGLLSGQNGSIDAKKRLWDALQLLGGLRAPAALAMWHIVGLQETVEAWAALGGWASRPLHKQAACGILIGALGALECHYKVT